MKPSRRPPASSRGLPASAARAGTAFSVIAAGRGAVAEAVLDDLAHDAGDRRVGEGVEGHPAGLPAGHLPIRDRGASGPRRPLAVKRGDGWGPHSERKSVRWGKRW